MEAAAVQSFFPQRAQLLDLPPEIRLEIYRLLLINHRPIQLEFIDDPQNPRWYKSTYWTYGKDPIPTLLTSRQISEEALDILYGENTFQVTLDACSGRQDVLSRLAPRNRHRIRRLELLAQPKLVSYDPPLVPNDPIWPSVLTNLTYLCLIAQLPQPRKPPDADALKREVDMWIFWLRPVLAYINEYAPGRLVVGLDYDASDEQMSELVRECFTKVEYRMERTWTGNIFLKKGQFSWKITPYLVLAEKFSMVSRANRKRQDVLQPGR